MYSLATGRATCPHPACGLVRAAAGWACAARAARGAGGAPPPTACGSAGPRPPTDAGGTSPAGSSRGPSWKSQDRNDLVSNCMRLRSTLPNGSVFNVHTYILT